ncbi:hypothetical protein BC477_11820 [Clavibacter michiganensis subsp. michiganensis]|uniref:Serine protease n=1 Tax=Clavibacter michiganensis subsp. michiganensis TaxID=33013 RepID=A0A251XI71_CLAMM|nr:hypothetical protein BC477_11820 [Clavibacter michiganensis subsp. michiganensis]OUE02482.1 hypothetical protein CMMCAS07_10730 [Clavibacter michiganensis subsp. michiganensis]
MSSAEAEAAVARWTPERRAAAIDADGAADGATDGAAGSAPADDALAASAASTVPVAEQVAPVPHMGRLFVHRDGEDFSCSANVVESANRSTIATAGHCLIVRQEFSTDMVFYPRYEEGSPSLGAFPVVGGNVTIGWYERNDDDQAEDTSFLAVAHDDEGDDVQSVAGASPVRFFAPAAQEVSMYGYPAAGRFDGGELERCAGLGHVYTEMQIDLGCDMTGGVSGGPILEGDGPTARSSATWPSGPSTGCTTSGRSGRTRRSRPTSSRPRSPCDPADGPSAGAVPAPHDAPTGRPRRARPAPLRHEPRGSPCPTAPLPPPAGASPPSPPSASAPRSWAPRRRPPPPSARRPPPR